MAQAETAIVNAILIELSKHKVVLWRNVRGLFLTPDGSRKVKAGLLADGASDLIGYVMHTVTENDMGSVLPVFCAVEVKTPTGSIRKEQQEFVNRLKSRGGKAGIARSVEDALKIINPERF